MKESDSETILEASNKDAFDSPNCGQHFAPAHQDILGSFLTAHYQETGSQRIKLSYYELFETKWKNKKGEQEELRMHFLHFCILSSRASEP